MAWCALVAAAAGTPLLINPGDRDFAILDPLWLAVAMFVAIPALAGLLIPVIADRLWPFYERAPLRFPQLLGFLPLLPALAAGPLFLGALLVGVLHAAAAGRARPAWTLPVARAAAAAVVLALAVIGVSEIADVEGRDPRPSDFVAPEL